MGIPFEQEHVRGVWEGNAFFSFIALKQATGSHAGESWVSTLWRRAKFIQLPIVPVFIALLKLKTHESPSNNTTKSVEN